jgi:hypothetical protein
VRWVSAVGDDAVQGGGVARGVSLFKDLGVISALRGEFLDLSSQAKLTQFKSAIIDVLFRRYRCFVVHSFFAPYVLMLLLIPVKISLVILPHGEMKNEALNISSGKKRLIINIIRFFRHFTVSIKKITVVASNEVELTHLKGILGDIRVRQISDIVGSDMVLIEGCNFVKGQPVNLVNIARMVENKGMGDFIDAVLEAVKGGCQLAWLKEIGSIHLFYVPEDPSELKRVSGLSNQLREAGGPEVFLYESYSHAQISTVLKTISNRVPFISSRFESFSYALVELSGLEYKPIVWFSNELVTSMSESGLCVKMAYGELNKKSLDSPLEHADSNQIKVFFEKMRKDVEGEYLAIFREGLDLNF